jgi:copper oxidase (laccase) domain-containing protein
VSVANLLYNIAMISSVFDGNMHPNLEADDSSAQDNFDMFCKKADIDPNDLVGLRMSPDWQDGARIATEIGGNVIAGSVECHQRQEAHAIILPKKVGGFVLSGDCYPVRLIAAEHHAVAHVGWRSVDDDLIPKLVQELNELGYNPDSLGLELGPGLAAASNVVPVAHANQLEGQNAKLWADHVKYLPDDMVGIDILGALMEQLNKSGINLAGAQIDGRDTYTDPQLFSRRAAKNGQKPVHGNHVFVAEPEV